MEGSKGANALLQVMRETTAKTIGFQVKAAILGTITSSGLKLDHFEHPIPLIDCSVMEEKATLISESTGTSHDYIIRLKLKEGDRVLCVPIDEGRTYIIIGQVK